MLARLVAGACMLGACGFSINSSAGSGEAGIDSPTVDPDARIIDAPPDANLVTTGLVAWYQMDTLSMIEDSSGLGHTGACTSCPDLVAGKIGNGFSFDGANDRINVLSTSALNTTTAFTVAVWVQFETLPGSGFSCLVSKYFGTGIFNSWQLCYEAADTAWLFATETSGGFTFLRGNPGPATNVWIHAAITWDGATKRIWVNGTLVDSQGATAIPFDTMPLTIGADLDNGQQNAPFRGILDDVRIYERVLTSAELAVLAAM